MPMKQIASATMVNHNQPTVRVLINNAEFERNKTTTPANILW